jgi:hypothetical protein
VRCDITYTGKTAKLLDEVWSRPDSQGSRLFNLNSAAACKRLRALYQKANGGTPIPNLIHTIRHTANTRATEQFGQDPQVVKYLVSLHGHKATSVFVDYQAKGKMEEEVEGEAAAAAAPSPTIVEDMCTDINDLETSMTELGGRVEEVTTRLQMLDEQMEDFMMELNSSYQRRFEALEKAAAKMESFNKMLEEVPAMVERAVRRELRMRLPDVRPSPPTTFGQLLPSFFGQPNPFRSFTGKFTRDDMVKFLGPRNRGGDGSPPAKRVLSEHAAFPFKGHSDL